MALDQGTTSSRAIVFDKHGTIIAKAQNEFDQIYPKAGWVFRHSLRVLLYNAETFHRDHLPCIKIGYMAGTGKSHKERPFIPYYKKQTLVLSTG